jgi:hypothetical protein
LRKERPFFQYTGHVVEHSSLLVVITFSSFVLSSFSSFTCAIRRKKKESLAQPLGFSHLAPPSTGQFHLKYHGSVVSCRRHFLLLLLQLFFFGNEKQICPLDGQQTPSLASCWRNKEETGGAHKGEKRKMPMSCGP